MKKKKRQEEMLKKRKTLEEESFKNWLDTLSDKDKEELENERNGKAFLESAFIFMRSKEKEVAGKQGSVPDIPQSQSSMSYGVFRYCPTLDIRYTLWLRKNASKKRTWNPVAKRMKS